MEHNEEALRLNLDLLDEKHDQVLKRTEDYQRKTTRYYDQKVKPRSYKLGDLVLKKLMPARKDLTHGKLGPNWEGPYIVSHVFRPGDRPKTRCVKCMPMCASARVAPSNIVNL